MASYRYRCLIPGIELETAGYNVTYNEGDAHICVFSKPVMNDLTMAKVIAAKGCRVVVDICDDHFAHPDLGYVYGKMLEIADYIVCPTENMKFRMQEFTEKDITVIGDPYEIGACEPHAEGNELLWFGHNVNLGEIEPYLSHNPHVVTGPTVPEWDNASQWSLDTLKLALSRANKVLLPTREGTGYKSPNRLINAIMGGCFPICDPHPANEEFKDFVWTGDIYTGLRWAREFEGDLNASIELAQNYIEDHYSPEAIGFKWIQLMRMIES
jgi:hypothetical protein